MKYKVKVNYYVGLGGPHTEAGIYRVNPISLAHEFTASSRTPAHKSWAREEECCNSCGTHLEGYAGVSVSKMFDSDPCPSQQNNAHPDRVYAHSGRFVGSY